MTNTSQYKSEAEGDVNIGVVHGALLMTYYSVVGLCRPRYDVIL